MAKGFLFTGEPLEDLRQVGFIGLIVAVGHFEQSKEVKFISYAAFWIKCELQRHAERCTGLKLSANAQALLYKLKRLEAEYKIKFGRVPTSTETSEEVSEEVSEMVSEAASATESTGETEETDSSVAIWLICIGAVLVCGGVVAFLRKRK